MANLVMINFSDDVSLKLQEKAVRLGLSKQTVVKIIVSEYLDRNNDSMGKKILEG